MTKPLPDAATKQAKITAARLLDAKAPDRNTLAHFYGYICGAAEENPTLAGVIQEWANDTPATTALRALLNGEQPS